MTLQQSSFHHETGHCVAETKSAGKVALSTKLAGLLIAR
jgi:hypothetical protein